MNTDRPTIKIKDKVDYKQFIELAYKYGFLTWNGEDPETYTNRAYTEGHTNLQIKSDNYKPIIAGNSSLNCNYSWPEDITTILNVLDRISKIKPSNRCGTCWRLYRSNF